MAFLSGLLALLHWLIQYPTYNKCNVSFTFRSVLHLSSTAMLFVVPVRNLSEVIMPLSSCVYPMHPLVMLASDIISSTMVLHLFLGAGHCFNLFVCTMCAAPCAQHTFLLQVSSCLQCQSTLQPPQAKIWPV